LICCIKVPRTGPFFSQPCQGATKSFPGLYMVVFFSMG
jgi:hypothetical protein